MKNDKAKDICQRIVDAGGKPYYVGGFVRDTLLGRQPKDKDIVVVDLDVALLQDALGADAQLVGADFPVFVKDGVEIAVARTERKTAPGYTGFSYNVDNVTLEQDLKRRDLTINAIAMHPFTGTILDPHKGILDLKARRLRPVGPHFGEDPVRVLRAARFAAQLDMEVTNELIEAAIPVLAEVGGMPGERLWMEIAKALRTAKPSVFFKALDKLGALEIVVPEIAALKGRIQPEAHHPEGDAYVHTLQVMDRARELGADDEAMFAAMNHDLGKAVTDDDNLPHHYNHEALGVPLVHQLCNRLHVPNTHRKTAAMAAKEHLNIHRFDDLKAVKKVRLLMRLGVIQNDLLARRVVLAAKADARGRGPTYANTPYLQGDSLLAAAEVICRVKGHQFADLKDGAKIAQRMEQARAKALKEAGFK